MKNPLRLSPLAMTAALAALGCSAPLAGQEVLHTLAPSGPGPAAGSGCPALGWDRPNWPSHPPTQEAPFPEGMRAEPPIPQTSLHHKEVFP